MTQTNMGPFAGQSASRVVASVWGVFAGLGGIRHGIGEVLQGNTPTGGIFIESWATGPIAEQMGGEPGITLIPNFLVTGIVIIGLSLVVMIWASGFMHKKHSGRVLFFLSVGMLLLGGGVGPPVIGMLAGWAGTGIHSPFRWWTRHLSGTVGRTLAVLWPWMLLLCFLASIMLFIGSFILVYSTEIMNADTLFFNLFLLVVITQILTTITGFALDLRQQPGAAVL